jgi:peptide/nickel transport system ATP-binding protein
MTCESPSTLINVQGLTKHFPVRLGAYGQQKAIVHALDDVTFDIYQGETLGLVGESGCGKTTAGLSILQLHRPTKGHIFYQGTDLTQLSERELRPLRQELQIIFQDPYSTLNPRMTIGSAISEPMYQHARCEKKQIPGRLEKLMSDVGLPIRYAIRYPHEFSGGQRQRICIARALSCDPKFIVCDEPVSALDVSIQAQITNLLKDLQAMYELTYLFIAHDLAVVKYISTRIAVMYLGKLVELAPRDELFSDPIHPYTQALLSAVPVPNPREERERHRVLLSGDVPSAISPPAGCRFHPRCPIALEHCSNITPEWRKVYGEHWVACHAIE